MADFAGQLVFVARAPVSISSFFNQSSRVSRACIIRQWKPLSLSSYTTYLERLSSLPDLDGIRSSLAIYLAPLFRTLTKTVTPPLPVVCTTNMIREAPAGRPFVRSVFANFWPRSPRSGKLLLLRVVHFEKRPKVRN